MSQSRMQSLIESWINILVGLGVSTAANFLIFPLFGWQISAHQNVLLALIYTVISLVRSYTLRRLFNRLHKHQERTMQSPDTRPHWMRWIGVYPDPILPQIERESCDYQGYEFGALYPDSECVGGYLWDADSGHSTEEGWVYTSGGDIPCPNCNARQWRAWVKEDWFSDAYDAAVSGRQIFRKAKRGHVLACFAQQLKAQVFYWWDARPRAYWGKR